MCAHGRDVNFGWAAPFLNLFCWVYVCGVYRPQTPRLTPPFSQTEQHPQTEQTPQTKKKPANKAKPRLIPPNPQTEQTPQTKQNPETKQNKTRKQNTGPAAGYD